MYKNPRIAGSVILFNPQSEFINNLYSYIDQVEKLYVLNNSEVPLPASFDCLRNEKKVKLINNYKNIGISAALNHAVKLSLAEGFNLLLTMDQDSYAQPEMVSKLLLCFKNDKIAIASPFHETGKMQKKLNGCIEVMSVMTSGNLIDLKIISEAGGFNEKLFIDYVDHEICCRLKSLGYKIIRQDQASLYHKLGDMIEKRFFFKKYYPTNHSPIRYYYQTRNRLYLYSIYKKILPEFVRSDKIDFVKSMLKMLISETNRFNKIKFIYRGFVDYKKDNFGKYNWK